MIRLINGDCLEVMDRLIGEGVQIDLTVTSPPYDDLRTYENSLVWNSKFWKAIIEKLYLITKNGGVVVWVVGDATINGSETGTSFKQALYFKEVGFNLHDTMIYQKTGIPFPSTNRYYQNFEYMFIFSKDKPKTFNPIKDKENKSINRKIHGLDRTREGGFKKRTNEGNLIGKYSIRYNIWKIPHAERGDITKHPASFPRKLARDHIKSWSNEKDIVFDPMMGGGTTGEAAKDLNRQFIGIEKVKKYYDLAKKRIDNTPAYEKESLFSGII